MKKEVFDHASDECLLDVVNGTATYGQCDIRQFPFCSGDTPHICFNRINRRDAFWPDKHPKYYIDYNRVHCYPDQLHGVDFTCSSCSPGRWCVPEGRCILDENKVRSTFAMMCHLNDTRELTEYCHSTTAGRTRRIDGASRSVVAVDKAIIC